MIAAMLAAPGAGAAEYELLMNANPDSYFDELDFSPDGTLMALSNSHAIVVYELQSMRVIRTIATGLEECRIEDNGTVLVRGWKDFEAYDAWSGERIPLPRPFSSFDFRYVGSAGSFAFEGGMVKIVKDGHAREFTIAKGFVPFLSPRGGYIIATKNLTDLAIYSTEGRLLKSVKYRMHWKLSRDDKSLAVMKSDGRVVIYDLASLKEAASLECPEGSAAGFYTSSEMIALLGGDGSLSFRSMPGLAERRRMSLKPALSLPKKARFLSDREAAVIGYDDGSAVLLNLASARIERTISAGRGLLDIRCAPGGGFLLAAYDSLRAFGPGGEPILDKALEGRLRWATYETDARCLVAVAKDGRTSVRRIDLRSGAELELKTYDWDFETALPVANGSAFAVAAYGVVGGTAGYGILEGGTIQRLQINELLGIERFFSSADGSLLVGNDGSQYYLWRPPQSVPFGIISAPEASWAVVAGGGDEIYYSAGDAVYRSRIAPGGGEQTLARVGGQVGYDLRVQEFGSETLWKPGSGEIVDLDVEATRARGLTVGSDGRVRIWSVDGGRELASFLRYRDGEWALTIPTGFFSASPGGIDDLAYRYGRELVLGEQLADRYFKPARVAAYIQGAETGASWDLDGGAPPLVEVSFEGVQGSGFTSRGLSLLPVIRESGERELIKITLKDDGGGIGGLSVYQNEKLVYDCFDVPGGIRRFDARVTLHLQRGINEIKVYGYSRGLIRSKPARFPVERIDPNLRKPDLHIIALGLDSYKNSAYDIKYAVSDAKSFAETLSKKAAGLFGSVRTTLILDDRCTKEEFALALSASRDNALPDDVFVLFYAGHGMAHGEEFYFVLRDVTQMSDPGACARFGMSMSELKGYLTGIKADKQVLLIDACQSGTALEGFARRGVLAESAIARLSRSTGTAILASTTREQAAAEYDGLGHGIFTYALLEGLGGKAASSGVITPGGMRSYIDGRLPELTERLMGLSQYPTAYITGMDFPIAVLE